MYDLLWEWRFKQRASDMESAAARSGEPVRDVDFLTEHFEARIEKLVLINMALWELLKANTELTDEDLLKKVQEIDMRDGKIDGKLQKSAKKCPDCGRVVNVKHNRCLYCGFQLPNEHGVFDPVME